MLVYQLDKPLEQLFLSADTFGTFHEKQAMSLVVDIQQETLDIILQDLLAETVVPVVIKVFNARSKPVELRVRSSGRVTQGFFLRKRKKERSRRAVTS